MHFQCSNDSAQKLEILLVGNTTVAKDFENFQKIRKIKGMHYIFVFWCRRNVLEKKLADAEVSEEEQNNILKYLEKKETEFMRRQRHKMGADDFEPLTMIGKGAFGEV